MATPTAQASRLPGTGAAFRGLLTDAAKRDDFAFGAALVAVFTDHLPRRAEYLPDPAYPADHANADLAALRGARCSRWMREYAAAAIRSGTTDFTVRRQYGQALIELKDFAAAINVLGALAVQAQRHIVTRRTTRPAGCSGVPTSSGTSTRGRAPTEVADDRDRGVLDGLRRGRGQGVAGHQHGQLPPARGPGRRSRAGDGPGADLPEVIARRVLDVLDARQAEAGHRDVWDDATRVEAHVALGEFTAASTTLTDYLTHPDMQPFEVSSTIGIRRGAAAARDRRGGKLLERLLECATRLRAGGRIGTAGATAKRFLVRVADPTWDPAGVPDLVLGTRLGTVVSIAGSEHTTRRC